MQIIAHRRNTVEELQQTPHEFGVEIDLRSYGSKLVVHHEPFSDAVSFDDWLESYQHQTLILNVKEEGLEEACLDCVKKRSISDFFFLDQSFPFLIKTSKTGERRCAVRVSEFESVETALTLAGKIDWVWVDCFSKFPLSRTDGAQLKSAGFKLCLVSPELQGRFDETEIADYRKLLQDIDLAVDAVCTKRPELWTS